MRMLFMPLAKDKNLELGFVVDPETPVGFWSVRQWLTQWPNS